MRFVAIGFGFLATLFLFLPLYRIENEILLGYQIIFGLGEFSFDLTSLIAFLIPSIASILLLINKKYAESMAMLFFLLGGFLFILLPSFLNLSNGSLNASVIPVANIIASVISFLGALLSLTLANQKNNFSTYQIVEMAMLVGIAIVLDLAGMKIRIGASGGSIGFTMVPLLILALRQGPIKGFIGAGIIYGFITCITDGWGLATFPFDYLLGYGAMGLAGIFASIVFAKEVEHFNLKGAIFLAIGVVIAVFGRLIASTVSGMIYYELDFWGSLVYNVLYILPSGGIALVLLIALYDPLIRVNRLIANRMNRE